MRSFRIGGGLVVVDNQLLLTANRRRQGTLEWTPPGGVIDDHETVLDGIRREVREETGLRIDEWEACHYIVAVTAPDMGWEMIVESWLARSYAGSIALDDPDGIVEQALFVDLDKVEGFLADSPLWVQLPVMTWLRGGMEPIERHHFHVYGADRVTARIEQLLP